MTRGLAYQHRNVAAGKCRLCPSPRVTAQHCAYHARRHSERVAAKANPLTNRVYVCSLCRKTGHNRRTCVRRKEVASQVGYRVARAREDA